jgi:hypothetical protein
MDSAMKDGDFMKTKEMIVLAAWMLIRAVSALTIGYLLFCGLDEMISLSTAELVASCVCSFCFGVLSFYMLRVCHWRFWVAVVIGVVLWCATIRAHVYTDPLYSEIYGHTRYFGLPLPVFRINECSTVMSSALDAKPGRAFINLLFWCFLVYAFVVAPRIVRWFQMAWRLHMNRIVVSAAVFLAVLALIIVFREEIAVNYYAPRNWQSPHGHERLPSHLWPERTWWESLKSYF